MSNWATVSLRQELVNEVRRILKTGHYRSISEFVSEAIRLRLEEISRNKGRESRQNESSILTAPPKIGDVEKYPSMAVDRLEQVWMVLVRFFEDLIRKNIDVDVEIAPELRNCRTLINFIRAHSCPGCDREIVEYRLGDLQHTLEKIKDKLIVAAALSVSENYAKDWVNKIDEAERAELDYAMIHTASRFVPGLPKDLEKGWIRLTLSKPIAEERVQEISRQFGVTIEFQDDFQIVVKGEKTPVKKAVQMIYRLQLE